MIRRILGQTLLTAVLFAGIFCLSGHAQLNNGTIRGTVTDSNGGVLPNANVTLTRLGTEEHFSTQSNKTGGYTFVALSPGDYEVQVDAPGFASQKGKLTLRVAQEAVIDEKLKVGSSTTNVTVQGDVTPLINTADATVSDVKEATRIETLPLQKSNFLNILNFTPGVVAGSYGGQGGGYTRVNGIPGGSITFQVDGQSANDRYTNDLQVTPQALQTIQELKITTSNGSAEYSTPGVIDVVTKGGTNEYHGQVHELYQTGGFEARGFNGPAKRPHLVHHEFGGQIGGPVWLPKLYDGKNKTFFYFDVEKQIERQFATDQELLPQSDWLQGNFSDLIESDGAKYTGATYANGTATNPNTVIAGIYDWQSGVYDAPSGLVNRTPFTGNIIPTNRQSVVGKNIANKVLELGGPNIPCPGQACFTSGAPNWNNPTAKSTDDITRYTGKLDQILGAGLLSARYTYTDETRITPDNGGNSGTLLDPKLTENKGHNGVFSYTRPIGGHAVNEARLGVQLFNASGAPTPYPGLMQSLGLPVYAINPTIGWQGIGYGGCNDYQCSNTAYPERNNPKIQPNQNITLGDNLSWTFGKHEVKIGASATNLRVKTVEQQNPGGNYVFSGLFTAVANPGSSALSGVAAPDSGVGLADMMVGEVANNFVGIVPIFHTQQTDIDGFIQDNWKLTPRLTLNLGVRYEYWTSYKDASGISANLNLNGSSIPLTPYTGPPVPGGPANYPTWFTQTQPTVVIPNPTKGQAPYNALVASYEANGLPVETASQAGVPTSLWNMPKNDWAPRVGFAYAVNPKTSLRAGYGIYYWTMPLVQYEQATRDNAPFFGAAQNPTDPTNENGAELAYPFGQSALFANQTQSITNNPRALGNVFINASNEVGSALSSGWGINPWDTNYKTQMAQEWNVTVERSLPGDWALELSYLGNHGSNLVNLDPINAPLPQELVPGELGSPFLRRPYANFATQNEYKWIGYSNHNEARVEVKHTFRGSFTLQSYFTWAKSLTTSEGTYKAGTALVIEPTVLTNNAPLRARLASVYAPDTYLANKTFSINGHYELPFGKGKKYLGNSNTVVDSVVSGWNASLFFIWHNGLPFSPFYSATGNSTWTLAPGNTNRGILPRHQRTPQMWFNASQWNPCSGNPYQGQTFEEVGCGTLPTPGGTIGGSLDRQFLNNIPRNYMTGPGFANADGTIQKMTPITKYTKLDIEMQVFNVFNHTNYANPSSGGVISSPNGLPRLLQFQGKIIF